MISFPPLEALVPDLPLILAPSLLVLALVVVLPCFRNRSFATDAAEREPLLPVWTNDDVPTSTSHPSPTLPPLLVSGPAELPSESSSPTISGSTPASSKGPVHRAYSGGYVRPIPRRTPGQPLRSSSNGDAPPLPPPKGASYYPLVWYQPGGSRGGATTVHRVISPSGASSIHRSPPLQRGNFHFPPLSFAPSDSGSSADPRPRKRAASVSFDVNPTVIPNDASLGRRFRKEKKRAIEVARLGGELAREAGGATTPPLLEEPESGASSSSSSIRSPLFGHGRHASLDSLDFRTSTESEDFGAAPSPSELLDYGSATPLRAQAFAAASDMAASYSAAKKARLRGDRDAAAMHQTHAESMKRTVASFHLAASEEIFRSHNKGKDGNRIDLHGLHSSEVERFLARWWKGRENRNSRGSVIVGKGNHSKKGAVRIGPAVQEWLDRRGIRWKVDPKNEGLLLVGP